jgi:hypothetical protein
VLALALSTAFVAAAAAPARQAPPAGGEAEALLARAEALAADGRYAEARRAYRELAEDWPLTASGRTAARRARPNAYLGSAELARSGPSENRVDVVVMGDGFTLEHLREFDRLAATVPERLERLEVMREYAAYFNWRRADVVSAEDGIDGFGRTYDTALGAYVAGEVQGQVAIDRARVDEVLAELAAHDGLALVIVKQATLGTGGSGVAVVPLSDDRVLAHEWGHAFGGLADEYATFTGHRQPGEAPNLSYSESPAAVPWRAWLERRVPGVGIYQGADGRERGAWKPVASDCVMENGEQFCPVCREAIVLAIHRRVDPIDGAAPPPIAPEAAGDLVPAAPPGKTLACVDFEVRVMQPATHDLAVEWWVLPAAEAPREVVLAAGADRVARGALAELAGRPAEKTRSSSGRHRFKLDPEHLAPGRYRVLARVTDGGDARGDRHPWVLDDPSQLLASERGWWVRVP